MSLLISMPGYAGLGATGFAVLACLAFASIGFPPVLPIIFIGIVLLSLA